MSYRDPVGTNTLSDRLGHAGGRALAPSVALGSLARSARLFHPVGTLLSGSVRRVDAPLGMPLGARLSGAALIRFSGALWKRREWPDVLGCAVRFGSGRASLVHRAASDQDLLFATVRNPWTTLLSPLGTNVRDYLSNRYFAVSPFFVDGIGRLKLRLEPISSPGHGPNREARLSDALRRGRLYLRIDARPDRVGGRYHPVALIELTTLIEGDDPRLRFDPFQTGRGIRPVGFVHHLRALSYSASRYGRGKGW